MNSRFSKIDFSLLLLYAKCGDRFLNGFAHVSNNGKKWFIMEFLQLSSLDVVVKTELDSKNDKSHRPAYVPRRSMNQNTIHS